MNSETYTITFQVNQTPEQVFDAINNVRGWWSEQVEGKTDNLGEVFSYQYKDVHLSKMKIIEFLPYKKVVWQVLENRFNFTQDKTEWTNTRISFEIEKKSDMTQVTFRHIGLVPEYECFEICSDSWVNYIDGSLRSLIETGKGTPNPYETAIKSAASMKLKQQH